MPWFPEWKRVLKTDGLLMFSCFGPDTLKELRAAAAYALPIFAQCRSLTCTTSAT
jgi:hypothetical protein